MDSVVEHELLTSYDIYLFKEGKHQQLYDKLGSHPTSVDGREGTHFAVWAPNAKHVAVIGDFNQWRFGSHPLRLRGDGSGIWEGFIPEVSRGTLYKYHIESRSHRGRSMDKGDPFALYWELPPRTASIVWDLKPSWDDEEWMRNRSGKNSLDSPWSIYEMHLGSWKRAPEDNNRWMTYRETAADLPDHLGETGFTHVEFLPIMEHPYSRSWGYQTLGYFSPTSRFGLPEDFIHLVNELHKRGFGVILDWVPSHFPSDAYGLADYDGTHLYEYADPRKGYHPDWNSYIFDFGKNEVRSFLMSSALFWLDKYHADGLRVDAVASMIYLDYSRKKGEWVPNKYGGRENLEAISFIRELNEAVYREHHDVQMIAEESTAWPMVSRPTHVGGLGFGMKWNMGWMHDTLEYMTKDPVYRKHHHDQLTFSLWYAFAENFVLPLSHDEVVYGKRSLLDKMPGDMWQKFANLRLLYGYMYGHPGKKLLFMGGELGQWDEWDFEKSLDWHLLEDDKHRKLRLWLKDLNRFYRTEPAMHQLDFERLGFEWLDIQDWEKSIVSFARRARNPEHVVVSVCNFTPKPRKNYRLGVPSGGRWKEVLNSDALEYGGSGQGNLGGVEADHHPFHGRTDSISITLPPLGCLFFRSEN
ncbi:1,4-alpha-glucan branching protein GlgB [Candidatus Bathyarchaeota archaeon]|nr:MAG: 1,4-alpha-glucan branching protein GlgB [Candidatus Bathyarchaeota archaeon]